MFGAAERGKVGFKLGDFFAENERGVADDALNRRVDFWFDRGVLGFEVNEGNGHDYSITD
jgi:hypothetical protein